MTTFSQLQLQEISRQLVSKALNSNVEAIPEQDGKELRFSVPLISVGRNAIDGASLMNLRDRISGYTGVVLGTPWIGIDPEGRFTIWMIIVS